MPCFFATKLMFNVLLSPDMGESGLNHADFRRSAAWRSSADTIGRDAPCPKLGKLVLRVLTPAVRSPARSHVHRRPGSPPGGRNHSGAGRKSSAGAGNRGNMKGAE